MKKIAILYGSVTGDGEFVGLPLDHDNENGSTDSRIAQWLFEIIPHLR